MKLTKWLKITGKLLLVLILLIAVGGWCLATFFEDDVKAYAMKKLDDQLTTRMAVSSLDLTLFEHFPQASLRFNDVLIEETFERKDTLLAAERVYLEFNIWDLIGGTYTLEAIDIENASVALERNAEGLDNFHFWKTDATAGEPLALDLEKIRITNARFSYADLQSEVDVQASITEGTFIGRFAEDIFSLESSAQTFVDHLIVGETAYIQDKDLNADVEIEINTRTDTYTFTDGEFALRDLPFMASGSVRITEEGTDLDLKVAGKEVAIDDATSNLPEKWRNALQGYVVDGDLDFQGSIMGLANASQQPEVAIDYSISDGRFVHNGSAVSFSDIRASGRFLHSAELLQRVIMEQVNAVFGDGKIAVRGSVSDFANPRLDLTIQGEFDLNDVRRFTELEALDVLEGRFNIAADVNGRLQANGRMSAADLAALKTSGKVQFADASFKVAGSNHLFENLKGLFRLENLNADIEAFEGNVSGSAFSMNGKFGNLIPYLMEGETLDISANLSSPSLNFNQLLSEDNTSDNTYHLEFPANLAFNINLHVDALNFRSFHATGLKGTARLRGQELKVDPISFNTSDGRFASSITMDGRSPSHFVLYSQSTLEGINVNQLFHSFENFGQDFLTADHLRGSAWAEADFRATLGRDLSVDPDKIRSTINIRVENGELIGLRSMSHIADFIEGNMLVAPFVDEAALREKLEHIRFATLQNKLEIRNGKILIPSMDIASSAMDISASGSHAFDNSIDYTLGFQVRDVLCKSSQTAFGTVEDDGLSNHFFLKMTGSSEHPDFGYDRMAHKTQRQENRQAEKQEFKDVIKNGFKPKADQPEGQTEPKEVNVTVDWGDDQAKPDSTGTKKRKWGLGKKKDNGDTAPPPEEDDDDY